ncbi:MAG: RecT family recombinase [Nanoarchaeota archaeon]|nr:RecT family recombinase [Nanoarchaeota archaeon]
MSTKEMTVTSNDPIVQSVQTRINELQKNEGIQIPDGYSPQNALISAMLILKGTKTRDKSPVLSACSKESIQNSLLDMVIQGLSPAKNQGYFIAYGQKLKFMRSYFGTMAVAKRLADIESIVATVVYKGDTFDFHIEGGEYVVDKHTTTLESLDGSFVAAYCIIKLKSGLVHTEIMTAKQIKMAWSKAKTQAVQKEFPDQMVKRTVINRAAKYFINTSNDYDLIVGSFHRSSGQIEDSELIEQKQVEITPDEEVDMAVEVDEKEPEPKTEKVKERVAERKSKPEPEPKEEEWEVAKKKLNDKFKTFERLGKDDKAGLKKELDAISDMDGASLFDSKVMMIGYLNNLEEDVKVSPEDAKDRMRDIVRCETKDRSIQLQRELAALDK